MKEVTGLSVFYKMPTQQTENVSQIVKESDITSTLLLLLVKHGILFSPYTIAHYIICREKNDVVSNQFTILLFQSLFADISCPDSLSGYLSNMERT